MSLATKPFKDAAKTLISSVCPRVYVSQVPDNLTTPKYPYVVLHWVRPIRTGTDHHMTSSRYDLRRGGLLINVVSLNADDAGLVADQIDDLLAGYRLPDCGEMIAEGRQPFPSTNTVPRPSTYTEELYFSFVTNLSWAD